jgi:hypothetical protein
MYVGLVSMNTYLVCLPAWVPGSIDPSQLLACRVRTDTHWRDEDHSTCTAEEAECGANRWVVIGERWGHLLCRYLGRGLLRQSSQVNSRQRNVVVIDPRNCSRLHGASAVFLE